MRYIKTYEQNQGTTFKEWLKNNPQDINTTEINCSDSNLIDLNGIEQFKNLKKLYCTNIQLTELPDLFNSLDTLEELYCHKNKLPYEDLDGYIEWHKKEYPWKWDAKKYNL